MITIKIKSAFPEYPFEYIISGHAGYAGNGNDIICSAVSALHYSLINWMNTEKIMFDSFDDGELAGISLSDERAACCFKMVIAGFSGIATNYPEYLRVIYT